MRKKFAINAKCATTFGTDFKFNSLYCGIIFPNNHIYPQVNIFIKSHFLYHGGSLRSWVFRFFSSIDILVLIMPLVDPRNIVSKYPTFLKLQPFLFCYIFDEKGQFGEKSIYQAQ